MATKNKIKSLIIIAGFVGFTAFLGLVYKFLGGSNSAVISSMVIGAVYALISYFTASSTALKVNNAQRVSKEEAPGLYKIVERVAKKANLPMPKVYIVEDSAANAFATGRGPSSAVMAVTTGLLETLNDSEVEAVVAHELGHIKNYDIRLMMIVFACVTMANYLINYIVNIFNRDENGNARGGFITYGLMMIISPIVSGVVQAAVSRQREYAADATSAELRADSKNLISALKKISGHGSVMRRQDPSTAHMFLANPLRSGIMQKLLATHPPMEDRIKALEQMKF